MISEGYHWQRPGYRKRRRRSRLSAWVLTALILSLVAHIALWIAFGTFKVSPIAKITLTEAFSIKRSTFDSTVLDQIAESGTNSTANDATQGQSTTPVTEEEIAKFTEYSADDIPADFIVNAEIKMTPAVQETENLAVDAGGDTESLTNPADSSAGDPTLTPSESLRGLTENTPPLDPNHPSLATGDLLGGPEETLADPSQIGAGGGGGDLVPDGYASLDQVLGMKGQGDPGKPIWVPTDVLFEFNSAELREDAKLSLMKLGALIMQRQDSEFILEGHTDTIGSEAYNRALSVNRATAIRNWLLEALRLDPARIKVKGHGESSPLVREGDAKAQAQNRRVEVTIQPLGTEGPF